MNPEIENERRKLKKKNKKSIEERCSTKNIKIYDFTKFRTICAFDNAIKNDIITMYMTNNEQNQLAKSVREFKSKKRALNPNMKKEKRDMINRAVTFLKGEETMLKAFGSGIFSLHTDNSSEQSE